MKNIYTFVLALACLLSFQVSTAQVQSWHPLPANQVLLYSFQQQGSVDEWYFAAHADSVRSEGADSAYYLYRIDRPVQAADLAASCLGDSLQFLWGTIMIGKDHYLGRKVLVQPDGDCYFVSSASDSFLLRSTAAVGNSWIWESGITATVDSIVLGNVLGAPDSLKYISLSSGRQLVLSRAHGLVECFSFLPFSDFNSNATTVDFHLWGIPSLGLGGHLPSYGEIFDFDVNDKFGIREHQSFPPNATTDYLREYVVQSKVPNTRFAYLMAYSYLEILNVSGFPIDSTYYPPITIPPTYDSLDYPLLQRLPYQTHAPATNFASEYAQSGVRSMAGTNGRIRRDFTQQTLLDTCAMAYVAFEGVHSQSFATGLGEIYYAYSDVGANELREMYCYTKGAETWGTCLDLSTLIAVTPSLFGQMVIQPNPTRGDLRITWPDAVGGKAKLLTLYSAQGQVLIQQAAERGLVSELELQDMPAGLYLLRCDAPGYRPHVERIVVAH